MDKIIEKFKTIYPLMQIEDYIKLLFQNEFGPEHLVTDKAKVIEYIKSELNNENKYNNYHVESIGNGLCRFHFNKLNNNELEVLSNLFMKTAELHKGYEENFINNLNKLAEKNKYWINDISNYLKNGIHPVHHSDIYRNEYKPHYRLIKYEYGVYFELICKINELIHSNDKVIIAIDGRCGSGKSKLVDVLSTLFNCNIIHIDDYFIPMKDRVENWKEQIAGNIDLDRIENEVLKNIKYGDSFTSKKYSCQLNEYSEEKIILNKPLTIVEGSYSQHIRLSNYYDYKVFLTCSSDIQRDRIIERNKDYYKMFESTWIPMEEKYFEVMNISENADIIIDNSIYFNV